MALLLALVGGTVFVVMLLHPTWGSVIGAPLGMLSIAVSAVLLDPSVTQADIGGTRLHVRFRRDTRRAASQRRRRRPLPE